jgi:prepilin-type N-terminal cleavage/methylation domain-containing protein
VVKNRQQKKRGFTIVELMVVIAVIGILLSIVVISYSGYQTRAKKSAVNATIQQVKLKLGDYYTDNNSFPKTKADVVTYLNSVNASSVATDFNTTKNSTSIVYTPTASGGGSCTTGSPVPACVQYTITVAPAYWGGGSSDTAISVTQ